MELDSDTCRRGGVAGAAACSRRSRSRTKRLGTLEAGFWCSNHNRMGQRSGREEQWEQREQEGQRAEGEVQRLQRELPWSLAVQRAGTPCHAGHCHRLTAIGRN